MSTSWNCTLVVLKREVGSWQIWKSLTVDMYPESTVRYVSKGAPVASAQTRTTPPEKCTPFLCQIDLEGEREKAQECSRLWVYRLLLHTICTPTYSLAPSCSRCCPCCSWHPRRTPLMPTPRTSCWPPSANRTATTRFLPLRREMDTDGGDSRDPGHLWGHIREQLCGHQFR